jgi:cell division protein FtsB
MDTLAIIIIAGLVTFIILVLIMRNTILSNRIEDAHIENGRLKHENSNVEKELNELNSELNKQLGQKNSCNNSAMRK